MATLISPGVSVTVIDETLGVSSGQGTVPMIFVATRANQNHGLTGPFDPFTVLLICFSSLRALFLRWAAVSERSGDTNVLHTTV